MLLVLVVGFVGVADADDFHVCPAPVLGYGNVGTPAELFRFAVDDFLAFQFERARTQLYIESCQWKILL